MEPLIPHVLLSRLAHRKERPGLGSRLQNVGINPRGSLAGSEFVSADGREVGDGKAIFVGGGDLGERSIKRALVGVYLPEVLGVSRLLPDTPRFAARVLRSTDVDLLA